MESRSVKTTKKFEKDVALVVRRGKDVAKLKLVIELLVTGRPLPRALSDHQLKGSFKAFRDLHIEPDWVLIYKIEGGSVVLTRTGTHADLFGK